MVKDTAKELSMKERTKKSVDNYIQKHPEKSVLIAAGIGTLIGAAAATAMMKLGAKT